MQTNLNCNSTQFGMAFRRPATKEGMEILSNTIRQFHPKDAKRGFQQFEKEQAKLKFFDTKFNPEDKSVEVIEKKTGKVFTEFIDLGPQTGFDVYGEVQYPGKKFFAKLFNPKRYLPKALYNAGEHAKKLDKTFADKEKFNKDLFI